MLTLLIFDGSSNVKVTGSFRIMSQFQPSYQGPTGDLKKGMNYSEKQKLEIYVEKAIYKLIYNTGLAFSGATQFAKSLSKFPET